MGVEGENKLGGWKVCIGWGAELGVEFIGTVEGSGSMGEQWNRGWKGVREEWGKVER